MTDRAILKNWIKVITKGWYDEPMARKLGGNLVNLGDIHLQVESTTIRLFL
jgi:hypothetical protein